VTAALFYPFGVLRADPNKPERGFMSKGTTRKTSRKTSEGNSKPKTSGKARVHEPLEDEQSAEREAILDERQTLKRLFPSAYSPDIGVFTEDKVEVMFKLTRSQAENLARLLKEHKL
jgi:hypothetical protein